jgi:DNA-binding NarL/FixJ family response regulator
LENTYYDLVLLGILLRKVGGIEILKKIREKRVKQGKIIIFSNYTEENIIKEAIELGADGFKVMADVTPAELPKLINDYLPGTISNKKGL